MFGVALAGAPLLGGCGDTMLTWTEEVQLLDGRVITVAQKRRIEERIEREAWLTFKLPEFGDKEIIWHQDLDTMVLNVYQNKLYIVGRFPSGRELKRYGYPAPPYIGFRYDNGQWMRIPFSEIPTAIYEANLFPDNMVLHRFKHVSVSAKAEMFKDHRMREHNRRVDPNYVIKP